MPAGPQETIHLEHIILSLLVSRVMKYTAIIDNNIVGMNRFINDLVHFEVVFEYSNVM